MSNVLKALARGGAAETDPNFKQTVLLLHGDGTNGAQNNTFLDSSSNNFTITRNGNTTQGTFSPFSLAAGEWSNYFDGTDDRLSVANNAAFDFGTGNFTIECWFYLVADATATTGGTRGANIVSVIPSSGTVNGYALYLSGNSTTTGTGIVFENTVSNTGYFATYTATISKNTWHHVAVARSGTTTKLFFNGAEVVSTTLGNQTVSNYSNATNIGASTYTGYTSNFPGYLSNVRIVKGTAVYTSAFTPSTAPLTAITNTSLLTCQSNRFVDNSTNNFAITRNGDVRVTPFSPFAPSAAYSAGTNGGSGYFDGTGDYLTAPQSTAFDLSGDFTVECWVYFSSVATTSFVGKWGGSGSYAWVLQYVVGTGLRFYTGVSGGLGTAIAGAWTAVANTWYHIAATRSSNSVRLFVDGVQVGSTTTNSDNCTTTNQALNIGRNADTNIQYLTGYIANLRILKGTGYTTITVPTAPLTAITNTSLLLNFTNAGIIDNTGKNVLETVGNAQIDTTTKKYGTGSLEFDGTGDWLLMPNTPDQQLGTGNFTIEFWVYLATGDTGSARGLVAKGGASTGWLVSLDSSQKVVFTYTTSTITSSGAITTNAWNHIAVVREGTGSNQTKIYIGGTNDGTGTVSTNFNQTESMYVGANRTGGDPMKGFIDDLRITKGVARYTANFTAPTKEFPDL